MVFFDPLRDFGIELKHHILDGIAADRDAEAMSQQTAGIVIFLFVVIAEGARLEVFNTGECKQMNVLSSRDTAVTIPATLVHQNQAGFDGVRLGWLAHRFVIEANDLSISNRTVKDSKDFILAATARAQALVKAKVDVLGKFLPSFGPREQPEDFFERLVHHPADVGLGMLADALLEVGEQQKIVLTHFQRWNVSEVRIQEVGMFVGIPMDLNPHLIA